MAGPSCALAGPCAPRRASSYRRPSRPPRARRCVRPASLPCTLALALALTLALALAQAQNLALALALTLTLTLTQSVRMTSKRSWRRFLLEVKNTL